MIFDFFAKTFNLFLKYKKEDIEGESDMVLIRKRQLIHNGIPDLQTVKNVTGERFNKLQEIFNRFDPVKTYKLSELPNKYELLTRTVIYKLPRQKTKEAVADLVYLEFSLWFKHGYGGYDRKGELVDEVFSFKRRYFLSDPFNEAV